jgi:hypothetical protein
MTPMDEAWVVLKQSQSHKFDFLGYSYSQEPFGIVTIKSSKGERKIPFYQRSGGGSAYNFETGQTEYEEGEPRAGQWVPFLGYDTDMHYGDSAQPYLIKPYHVFRRDKDVHKRYAVPQLKEAGEWLDRNHGVKPFDPNTHDEIHWEDANQMMLEQGAVLAEPYRGE